MLSTSAVKWKGNSQSERNKSVPPTDPVQHLPQTQPRFTSCVLICNRGRLVSHTYFYRTINRYQCLSPWQRTDSLMFHWCFSHDRGSLCSGLGHLFKHHQLQQQLRMHYFLFKMLFFFLPKTSHLRLAVWILRWNIRITCTDIQFLNWCSWNLHLFGNYSKRPSQLV